MWEVSYFKCVQNFLLNSQATVQIKLVSKFSHLGASPPHLGLVRVLLPVTLVAERHLMASPLDAIEASHPGHGASSMQQLHLHWPHST